MLTKYIEKKKKFVTIYFDKEIENKHEHFVTERHLKEYLKKRKETPIICFIFDTQEQIKKRLEGMNYAL